MWIFTTVGFFSVVQKPGQKRLTVRARSKKDLDQLRKTYLPKLSKNVVLQHSDYPVRATVSHKDFADALVKMVHDVTYDNFKNEVARAQGPTRAHTYHRIWDACLDIELEAGALPAGRRSWLVVPKQPPERT